MAIYAWQCAHDFNTTLPVLHKTKRVSPSGSGLDLGVSEARRALYALAAYFRLQYIGDREQENVEPERVERKEEKRSERTRECREQGRVGRREERRENKRMWRTENRGEWEEGRRRENRRVGRRIPRRAPHALFAVPFLRLKKLKVLRITRFISY